MIVAYMPRPARAHDATIGEVSDPGADPAFLLGEEVEPGRPIPADALWIDLIRPTRADDLKLEAHLGISIPTLEDMEDIEPSELLYVEDGARYMTARLICRSDSKDVATTGVTFILKDTKLVTVRYEQPYPFKLFAKRASKPGGCGMSAQAVLAGLFEAIIDRAADILQMTGAAIDQVSGSVFKERDHAGQRNAEYQATLQALGRHGDLVSKTRESLVSIERILLFLTAAYRAANVPSQLREEVKTSLRDLQSLEEHATFQAQKIQFLLDATLGLVNLEQNNIIKLFSVMAVIFMPPTLIASIYGMNFKLMPELEWQFGYPMALGAMLLAAVLPFAFFRWKRWL